MADYAVRMGSGVVVLAVGLLAAWIGWKFMQRQRFLRKLAVDRIAPEELRRMLEAGEEIVVVDVRSALESDVDSVPGALRIPLEDRRRPARSRHHPVLQLTKRSFQRQCGAAVAEAGDRARAPAPRRRRCLARAPLARIGVLNGPGECNRSLTLAAR